MDGLNQRIGSQVALTGGHRAAAAPARAGATGLRVGQKRLLYIGAVLPPTRAPEADHVLYQSLYFAKRGIDVHILTRSGQGIAPHPAVTVHDIIDTWSWPEMAKVVRLVKRLAPDAIMMSFLGSLYGYRSMPTMIPAIAKLLRPRSKFLVQFANIGQGGGLRSGVGRFLFKHLGRRRYGSLLTAPDVFVALSEEHRQKILALAPSAESDIHIVPCCPQMPMAQDRAAARRAGRKRLGIADDETAVTFFGRLYPGKGIEQLVEAVGSLRATHPKIRLSLIGGLLEPKIFFNVTESYEEELKACVRRHGMADAVRFSGEYVWDGPEASEYLHAADVAVLPLGPGIHLHNGSLAALCAHRLPVIGTRGAIVDPALRHGENVYFINDSQAPTIADALRRVLDDQDLRRGLSEGAEKLAAEYFEWGRAVERISDLMGLSPATRSDAPS